MRLPASLTLPVTVLIQAASAAASVSPSIAAPALLLSLGLSSVAVGMHMTLMFAAAMVSVQYSPALIKLLGPIRASQLALLTSATGLVLVGVPHLAAACLGTILIGAGGGPVMPASSEMLVRISRPERLGFAFSVKQTGVPLGGIIAAFVVPQVLTWSSGFVAMCFMAGLAVLAAGSAQGFREAMDDARDPRATFPRLMQLTQAITLVLQHRHLRPLAFLGVALCATQFSLTSYLVTFLSLDLGWSIVSAGFALAVAQASGALGRLAWGWLSDSRLGERKTLRLMVIGMACASLAMPLMPQGAASVAALAICALFGATAVGWTGLIMAAVARVAPEGQVVPATAGTMTFNYLGIMIGPVIFGMVAKGLGSHALAYAALGVALLLLAAMAFRFELPGRR